MPPGPDFVCSISRGWSAETGRERVRRVSVSIERESNGEFWPSRGGFRPERRQGRREDRARRATGERRRVLQIPLAERDLWPESETAHRMAGR